MPRAAWVMVPAGYTGSTIDQLKEDGRPDSGKPEEIIANAFAAFFLMPSVGLRGAFARPR